MSKYRQADVNSLNEINKLRGNSLMDQAFMNATNFVAGGMSEGFKGYQAQRQADEDQKYREKMDQFRAQMDQEKMQHEKKKFRVQQDQFNRTYGQKRTQFNRSQRQREDHFASSFDQREQEAENRDAYQRDRDAHADMQFAAQQGLREAKNTRDELTFGNTYTTKVEALDVSGNPIKDAAGNTLYSTYTPGGVAASAAVTSHVPHSGRPSQPMGARQQTPARKKSTYTKQASLNHLGDIVSRLRDRNL
jgi:hypothetical protein